MARIPLIVDCDPGIDDALALLLALASPEVELLGVTSVAGNVALTDTTANALRVLELAGRGEVPVAAGCSRPLIRPIPGLAPHVHGRHGLGNAELPEPAASVVEPHAVDFIAGLVLGRDDPVTLAAVGPLTNVALLLARHPEVERRLGRVVIMGGALGEGNVTPAAEFNVWFDPEAAARVFASELEITLVPLEATRQALFGGDEIERLRGAGRCGAAAAAMLDFYADVQRDATGASGLPLHDPLALAEVIAPGICRTERMHVAVEYRSALTAGATPGDRLLRDGVAPNMTVAVGCDRPRFVELVLERIGSLG